MSKSFKKQNNPKTMRKKTITITVFLLKFLLIGFLVKVGLRYFTSSQSSLNGWILLFLVFIPAAMGYESIINTVISVFIKDKPKPLTFNDYKAKYYELIHSDYLKGSKSDCMSYEFQQIRMYIDYLKVLEFFTDKHEEIERISWNLNHRSINYNPDFDIQKAIFEIIPESEFEKG